MPAPKIPAVVADVERLNEPFKAKAKKLLAAIDAAGLPMRVFETVRPLERQRWLFDKGYSKAAGPNGPHPWGLAIDIILDAKSKRWPAGVHVLAVGGGGSEWDTGYDPVAGGKVELRRPGVADVVRAFGALAVAEGLTWGGTNAGAWASAAGGAEFGWDPFHVQLADWRAWTKHLPAPL